MIEHNLIIRRIFCNHCLQIRLNIINLPDNVDKLTIIQTETVKLRNLRFVRELLDHAVIAAAHETHNPALIAFNLLSNHDLRTGFPLLYKGRQQLRRILKIPEHQKNCISVRLLKR